MEEKIKDIYDCEKLVGDDPLVVWHNQVIEKNLYELTIGDVARCIRQNLFIEKVYEVLLAYLLHNPYEGDLYAGELMDKASEVDSSIVKKYKTTISEIIAKATQFINTNNWIYDDEKQEFIEAVDKLENLIK